MPVTGYAHGSRLKTTSVRNKLLTKFRILNCRDISDSAGGVYDASEATLKVMWWQTASAIAVKFLESWRDVDSVIQTDWTRWPAVL